MMALYTARKRKKCAHGKISSMCKECGGVSLCIHNRLRWYCALCKGNSMCEHNRRKEACVVCRGTGICCHGRRRCTCVECGGNLVCEHKISKYKCLECIPVSKLVEKKWVCRCCLSVNVRGRRRVSGLCFKCDETSPPRWEHIVWNIIKSGLPPPSATDNKMIGGCDSRRTRPDICWVGDDRIVHLEIDEHSHTDREVSCELSKLDSANWGVHGKHLPTVVVRFNPNEYDVKLVTLTDRCNALVRVLKGLFVEPVSSWSPYGVNVVYMFYHTKSNQHIDAARKEKHSIRILQIV